MDTLANRVEKDFLGELQIPKQALYGIHSVRASKNFPSPSTFQPEWYRAMATVKKSCFLTAKDYFEKAPKKANLDELKIRSIDIKVLNAMIACCCEMEEGKHFESFIVPAISGGAGTSINLNINEIIANRSLFLLGRMPGDYALVDPIEHANIFQSTNDVVPSALKLATYLLLNELELSINNLRQETEALERKYSNHLRKGFTQMQEAVPGSYGRLFSTYSEALSRDWWRVSKCFERIKVVNLGGSAIGSGITVPRYFIMEVSRKLQDISGVPITRAENLYDATNNLDALVEVHGILKAHAVNLEKMLGDFRILSSDFNQNKELEIPALQTGSSIMPGKVNPVIPEYVISCAHKVYANDALITSLCAQGCLELNAYLPIIGHTLLESIKLLITCNNTTLNNMLSGIVVRSEKAENNLYSSPSIATVFIPFIGYNKSAELAKLMKDKSLSIFEANAQLKLMNEGTLKEQLQAHNILKEGFSLKDINDFRNTK